MAFMVPEYHEGEFVTVVDELWGGEVRTVPAVYFEPESSSEVIEDHLTGVGVHLTAPGYMDQTEWSVFPSMAEARAHLLDFEEVDPDSGESIYDEAGDVLPEYA